MLRRCIRRKEHFKEHPHAVHKTGHGPQRHQRIHVGRAVDKPLEAADEKLLVDHHDDGGKQQLRKAERSGGVQKAGNGEMPHGVAHGNVHEQDQEKEGREQPFFEPGRFSVPEGIVFRNFLRCVFALHAGAVACLFHGGYNVAVRAGSGDLHGVGQQIDGAAFHAADA